MIKQNSRLISGCTDGIMKVGYIYISTVQQNSRLISGCTDGIIKVGYIYYTAEL